MPASVYHVFTSPVADGTATSVVQPSDWNSGHVVTLAPTGAEIIGAFSNGGNVTFGTNASGYVTATAPAGGGGGGVAISAGTNSTSTGTVVFANSNGLTFGMDTNGAVTGSYTVPNVPAQTEYLFSNANGVTFGTNASTVTASVQTNYAATDVTSNNMAVGERGNYFYTSNNTFANSTHSHGNIAFSGTNVSATFTTASNGLSIQLSAPTVGGAQTGVSGISAGTTQATSGTVVFSDANGVSFGVNGNTLTASHNGITQQSTQPVAYSAGNGSAAFSTLKFADSQGVSFSTGTQGVYATVKTDYQSSNANYLTSQSNQAFSAANGSAAFQTITFANSNGVSFSTGTQGLYASHNGITQQSTQPVAYSAVNGSAAFSTLTFANSNGVSFSTGTQGLYATVRTDYLTTARASNDAVGLNTAVSNVTATINSSGISIDGRGYAGTQFSGTNISGTINSNGVSLSVNPGGAGGDGYNIIGVNGVTNTSLSATLVLSNANNVTFGLNVSTITASASYPAQTAQPVAYSAANGSANFSTLIFANSNGVSFSTGTQGLYATVRTDYQSSNANYLTSQSNQAYSAGNGSAAFQTITFADSNGVSFSTGTQGVYATVKTDYQSSNANYLTSQSNQAYSAANGSAAFQTITFANSNGVSFSTGTQGLYATVKTDYLTQQSTQPVAYSAANGSANFSTLTFANSNGVSFSSGTQGLYATVKTDYQSSNANYITSQTAQTANFYVSGNTTQLSSTAGVDLRSVSFEGAGIASVGVSNGRVLVSVPTGGGAGDGYNIVAMGTDPVGGGATSGATFSTLSGSIYLQAGNNMTLSQTSNSIIMSGADVKWSLVGNTAGTNSSNLSANSLYFSGGPNITLSGNSNTIVVSAAAGGVGGGTTVSWYPPLPLPIATSTMVSGTSGNTGGSFQTTAAMYIGPMQLNQALSFGEVEIIASHAALSAGTGSVTIGHQVGIYSLNGGTALSRISSFEWNCVLSQNSATAITAQFWWGTNSTSNSTGITGNSSASLTGPRVLKLYDSTGSLPPGDYWIAQCMTHRSSSVNIASGWFTGAFLSQSQSTLGVSYFGNSTVGQVMRHIGSVTTTQNNANSLAFQMPVSINTTAITNTGGTSQQRIPVVRFYI